MADLQALTKSDFTGGFTDNLFDQDPTKCFYNDNVFLDNDNQLLTRPGSQLLASGSQPGGNVRVSRFMFANHGGLLQDTLLAYAVIGRSIYSTSVDESGGGVAGPLAAVSTDIIANSSQKTNYPWGVWNGYLYMGAGHNTHPLKYIPTSTNNTFVTMGMPPVANENNFVDATVLASAIALSTSLKAGLLYHYSEPTPGLTAHQYNVIDTASTALLPGVAPTNLASLIAYINSLLASYALHFSDITQSNTLHFKGSSALWGTGILLITTEDQRLASTVAPTTLTECVDRLNDLAACVNVHRGNRYIHSVNALDISGSDEPILDVDAGPRIDKGLSKIYAYLNTYATKYAQHKADISLHVAADTVVIPYPPATNFYSFSRLLWELQRSYFTKNSPLFHENDAELGAGWVYHFATNTSPHAGQYQSVGASVYPYGGAKFLPKALFDLNAQRIIFNAHVEDDGSHYVNPSVNMSSGITGVVLTLSSYLYAFVYKREVTADQTTQKIYSDIGKPLIKAAPEVVAVEYAPINITQLPVFANNLTNTHWITDASLKLQIYRTSNGGTDFYLVGEVANGVTSFIDTTSDVDLTANEPLYTNSGEVENDIPPACLAFHIANGYGYYGNTATIALNGFVSDYNSTRVYQSKKDDIDSVPGTFYEDMESAVVGINSIRSVVVVFCASHIYRLEGSIDDLGRGGLNPIVISKGIGCVSEASIVATNAGIIFAGTDGFYFTDGYTTQILSEDWRGTYQTLIATSQQRAAIMGAYDPFNRFVYMSVRRANNGRCRTWLCLHLDYGIKRDATWTSASNGSQFSAEALLVTGPDVLLRGDTDGYVYTHSSTFTTDPFTTTTFSSATWGTKPIVPDYQTCQMDFGDRSLKKWVPKMSIVNKQLTALNLAINVNNDDGKNVGSLAPIDRDAVAYSAPTDISFGTPSNPVTLDGTFEEKRHFPARTLRCNTKQLQFTSPFLQLRDSVTDADGAAVFAGTTATLSNALKSWPVDCVGQYLSVVTDGYTARYLIQHRTSATVLSLTTAPPAATVAWRISGYAKNQRWKMLSFTLRFTPHDFSQDSSGDEA